MKISLDIHFKCSAWVKKRLSCCKYDMWSYCIYLYCIFCIYKYESKKQTNFVIIQIRIKQQMIRGCSLYTLLNIRIQIMMKLVYFWTHICRYIRRYIYFKYNYGILNIRIQIMWISGLLWNSYKQVSSTTLFESKMHFLTNSFSLSDFMGVMFIQF